MQEAPAGGAAKPEVAPSQDGGAFAGGAASWRVPEEVLRRSLPSPLEGEAAPESDAEGADGGEGGAYAEVNQLLRALHFERRERLARRLSGAPLEAADSQDQK